MDDAESQTIVVKRANRKRTLSRGDRTQHVPNKSPATCSRNRPKSRPDVTESWFDNSFCSNIHQHSQPKITREEAISSAAHDALNSSDLFLASVDLDSLQTDCGTTVQNHIDKPTETQESKNHDQNRVIGNPATIASEFDQCSQGKLTSINRATCTEMNHDIKSDSDNFLTVKNCRSTLQHSTERSDASDFLEKIFNDVQETAEMSQTKQKNCTDKCREQRIVNTQYYNEKHVDTIHENNTQNLHGNNMKNVTNNDNQHQQSCIVNSSFANVSKSCYNEVQTQPTQPVRLKSHVNSQYVNRARLKKNIDCDSDEIEYINNIATEVGKSCDGVSKYVNAGMSVLSENQNENNRNVDDHLQTIDVSNACSVIKQNQSNIQQQNSNTTLTNESKNVVSNIDPLDCDMFYSSEHNKTDDKSCETPPQSKTFQSRIRDRMHKNAKTSTTPIRNSTILRDNHLDEFSKSLYNDLIKDGHSSREALKCNQNIDGSETFFGLPQKVQELFAEHRGITKLYDWQRECLQLPSLLKGDNLIYSLPTSGGKTLVAEVLILKEILCKRRDALLILPFVSIVQEKVRNFASFAADLDFLVEEYAGSKGRLPPMKRRNKHSIYIATIEKAHSLVNSLIETEKLTNIGLVVIDELHMIGEGGSRGSTLEMTLLKIKHASDAQLIGMSATLSNTADLQTFLNAQLYTNNFRPVELTENVKLDDNIYTVNNKTDDVLQHSHVLTFQYTKEMLSRDPDQLLGLVTEVIPQHSCLVFCATKKNCENIALHLCRMMSRYKRELALLKKSERKSLYNELVQDGSGKVCPVLQSTLKYGVAYHHSGLTMDERRLIEDAYSEGVLCVLACTSTLAAGVNLPAKRVILRSPYVGCVFIRRSQYMQMIGRAGRAGIDTSGESIVVTQAKDKHRVLELLTAPLDTCKSSLMYDGAKGIRSLVLSLIGLKLTTDTKQLFTVMSSTLLSVQRHEAHTDIMEQTRDSLQQLVDMALVKQVKGHLSTLALEVTTLGRATFKGSIDIDDASRLHGDLMKAEESLVLTNHLHLLYLVTPYDMARDISPDWMTYFNQLTTDTKQLFTVMSSTLLSVQRHEAHTDIMEQTRDSLQQLVDMALVKQVKGHLSTLALEVTTLGRATFKGSIDIDDASRLHGDLMKAEESLVLTNHLHLLYLVTPYDMARDISPDWMTYFNQVNKLDETQLTAMQLIGVPEGYITRRASGQTSKQKVDSLSVQRFYLTLVLHDLWNNKSVWDVATTFQLSRGYIQNLLTSSASFAVCTLHFCQEMEELWPFVSLLADLVKRLTYCVNSDLIPLMEIPGVKMARAKQLYTAGYTTLASLVNADPQQLVINIHHMSRHAARQIVTSAKVLLSEKMEALLEEVDQLVTVPEATKAVVPQTCEESQEQSIPFSDSSQISDIT